jgi:fatty acid amide hydrolase 2
VPFLKQLGLRFNYAYTAILNVLQLPATQVPLGMDRLRLPLGVQVVARHGQDHLSIATAELIEEVFGGWEPPAIAGLNI